MVKIPSGILVRPVTRLTIETRLTRTATAWMLHDHRLTEVLVEL